MTEKANFTSVLCLFLSRCLIDDKKSDFEKLQLAIEQLQRTRFDLTASRQKPSGEHKKEATVPKHAEPSHKECELVQCRDALLRGVLQESLESVLPIANDTRIREKLRTFAETVKNKSPAKDRFHSYVHMYNSALDELAKTKIPFLREEDLLGLRLCRADPKETSSTSPDFVRTSKAAALNIHGDGHFGAKPITGFKWHQVLSCEEMMTPNSGITERAEVVLGDEYLFTDNQLLDNAGVQWLAPVAVADTLDSQSKTRSCSKRVRSESSTNDESEAKRYRVSESGKSNKLPGDSAAKKNAEASGCDQVDGYATEMMSYCPGVVHVINTLIIDEWLYIWYYDRQGSICSSGVSIIADFPLFLGLLLAFQRFIVDDWGVVPFLNPQVLNSLAINNCTDRNTVTVELPQDLDGFHKRMDAGDGPMLVHLNDYLSSQPYRRSGRMTSVLKASLASNKRALACKIYSPEVHRVREDDVLGIAVAIAEKREPDMCKHLPKLYVSGDVYAGNTLRVRSMLRISGDGHRTLRIVVMNELAPLTSLPDAASVLKAWFDIVVVHAFLWTHGIEHGDPSLWNMMVDPGNKCGVLTDYDLSVLVWLEHFPATQVTGTIPFMALELLDDNYWDGHIKRYYHHELEAILWVLIAVSIASHDGKFVPRGTVIQSWFTPDHTICCNKKAHFAQRSITVPTLVLTHFSNYRRLVGSLARLIGSQYTKCFNEISHDETGAPMDVRELQIRHSMDTWDKFMAVLSQSGIPIDSIDFDRLQSHKPDFTFSQNCERLAEMSSITDNLFQNIVISE